MAPQPPYDWPPTYPHHWVWTGWDGINRSIPMYELYSDQQVALPSGPEEDA